MDCLLQMWYYLCTLIMFIFERGSTAEVRKMVDLAWNYRGFA
jgi:hypothetical protein